MPGVQEKYTIDVTNRFGLVNAEDDEDEEIENVDPFEMINDLNKKAIDAKNAPKPKVAKKKAPVATPAVETKEEDKRGDNRRGGNRGARRGARGNDRPRGDRPPRQQNGEIAEGAPQREDRPRGGRGGRGRGVPRRDGERRLDRKSGDPKTSYKGSDKREGAGANNWGTPDDDLKAQTEPAEEKTPEETTEVGQGEPKATETVAVIGEKEEQTMTLEEYRAQKKNVNRNPNARIQEEKEVAALSAPESRKKGRAARVEAIDFKPVPLSKRGGDGDRNRQRGRGRGGAAARGDRPRTEDSKTAEFNLADDFPTLG